MNQNNRFDLTENDKNYKVCFHSDAGQRVIEDLKKFASIGEDLYHPKQTHEELTYLLGMQKVVNHILFTLSKEQKRE